VDYVRVLASGRIPVVPRKNYDLPRNQSDRSFACIACLSVSTGLTLRLLKLLSAATLILGAHFRHDLHGASFVRTGHAPNAEYLLRPDPMYFPFSPVTAFGSACSAATARIPKYKAPAAKPYSA
jgi:hypothetical protein